VDNLLNNPVFYSLSSIDAHLGSGTQTAKYFDEEVSPFAGFSEDHENGFDELYSLLPARRKIIYATRSKIKEPAGWQLLNEITGFQFVYNATFVMPVHSLNIVALQNHDVDEMIALARLTKPGPFDKRTIEFGHYYGIFENEILIAMAGQRLHVGMFTEISAVCTHPGCLGKGYAAALLLHQMNIIIKSGQIPFLHVRDDNARAIALYERLGFKKNGVMNFYFFRRR
jgi:predicted GNAT family acetyltransferase